MPPAFPVARLPKPGVCRGEPCSARSARSATARSAPPGAPPRAASVLLHPMRDDAIVPAAPRLAGSQQAVAERRLLVRRRVPLGRIRQLVDRAEAEELQ